MQKTVDGLAYDCIGSGPPLLMMHGPVGLDHSYLRPWLDPLAECAELIYYDHRGHGASDEPSSWESLSIERWADDAEALREHLGHDGIFVFGHSLGAGVALEYSLRNPNRVRGLVLCGAAANLDHVGVALKLAETRGTEQQLETVQNALGAPIADDHTLRDLWKTILPLYFEDWNPEFGDSFLDRTRFSARAFNRGMLECFPSFDIEPRLGHVRAPTLLVSGAADWITPPDPCLHRFREIPRCQTAVFDDSGHFPFVEERTRFIELVRRWIDENAASQEKRSQGSSPDY